MKRLETNLESTIPLINSDFNDILQDQHRIAYSAYLDGINDMKYSTFSTNRGIILSGLDIKATSITTDTSYRWPRFDWEVKINKSTSLVYFDGQYYTPSDDLLIGEENNTDLTINFDKQFGLIITPFTQSVNQNQNELYKSSIRTFKNGLTQSVTIDYRFNLLPIDISSEEQGSFGVGTPLYTNSLSNNLLIRNGVGIGVPYILFSFAGTSRNLSRLIKYNLAVKDDILISYDLVGLQSSRITGGKFYRDFLWNSQRKYEFSEGINELKGFGVLSAMGGRFPVGYDSSSPTSPQNADLLQFNYGTPSNIGGTVSLTFSSSQLPTHNHGLLTSPPIENLDHSHPVIAVLDDDDNFSGNGDYIRSATVPGEISAQTVFLTRGFDTLGMGNTPSEHKHSISSSGLDIPHENRPPYQVVLYYYKI